jgi:hypothetical protein
MQDEGWRGEINAEIERRTGIPTPRDETGKVVLTPGYLRGLRNWKGDQRMSAMTDRVALVLAAVHIDTEGKWTTGAARVVLTVMREPTEAMLEAAFGPRPEDTRRAGECWRAMIDAALTTP